MIAPRSIGSAGTVKASKQCSPTGYGGKNWEGDAPRARSRQGRSGSEIAGITASLLHCGWQRQHRLRSAPRLSTDVPEPSKRRWPRWSSLDAEILEVWAPAVANLILLPLVGSIDLFWIGQSRDPWAIAGMGAANQVYSTIYFLISFLPAVVTPRIAEEIARGRKSMAAKWVREALGFACLMGAFGTLALVSFPHVVLKLISDRPQVLAEAIPYARIRGLSLIATLCSTVSFATFRGLLDFRTPLRVSLAANMLNACLDPLLMFGFGLGVSGVAAATSIAELFSAVTFMSLLRRRGLLEGLPSLPDAGFAYEGLGLGLRFSVGEAEVLPIMSTTGLTGPLRASSSIRSCQHPESGLMCCKICI
ncbi:DTX44 [Symbiodinium sp. CCMP2456]|nr:DTX44 [Symbiodinium sp. CCMP2456]